MDYLGQTGLDALKGADILKAAPDMYTSSVEYADTGIARNLQGIAKVLTANLGTRVFYTQQGGYDTHRQRGRRPSQAPRRPQSRRQRLLRRSARARCRRQRGDVRLHRVRPPRQGQRQRHRPRQRRRGLRHRRSSTRRHVRRLPIPGGGRSRGGRTLPSTPTSAACTARWSSSGWAWTRSRW